MEKGGIKGRGGWRLLAKNDNRLYNCERKFQFVVAFCRGRSDIFDHSDKFIPLSDAGILLFEASTAFLGVCVAKKYAAS